MYTNLLNTLLVFFHYIFEVIMLLLAYFQSKFKTVLYKNILFFSADMKDVEIRE